jgi:2-methylcitrate dehydratase PrpD
MKQSQKDPFADQLWQLCEWAVAFRAQDLPAAVQRRAAIVLADDIAAMLAGAGEPEVRRYRERVLARRPIQESTVFAPGLPRVDRMQAASINALSGTWCELDEGFRRAICHAGIYVLPALLAEASAEGLTLGEVLRALSLGYEVVTRLAMSTRYKTPVVHAHALWSAVGAAASVVLARQCDAHMLFRAVTAAATTSSLGPRPHLAEGVLIRNGWAAAGAVNGLQCADWADAGIGGAGSSIPAVHRDLLGATLAPEALTANLGREWSIESGYQKIYACCQHGHAAVEAALALVPGLHLAAIGSIDVHTHPLALTLPDPEPVTTLGAKFSLPHMVAAALVYGEAGAAAFSSASLDHCEVRRLRHVVRLMPWKFVLEPPHDRPARVEIFMRDGSRQTAECPSALGGPDRPLPIEALIRKIDELAQGVLPRLSSVLLGDQPADDALQWDVVIQSAACAEGS